MTFSRIFAHFIFIISCFFTDFANAVEPMLVKKQQFELTSFTTQNGAVIAPKNG